MASAAPERVDSLAVVESEAYALLRTQNTNAYAQISGLPDRWRAHLRAGGWYEDFDEFIDFYNGPDAVRQPGAPAIARRRSLTTG